VDADLYIGVCVKALLDLPAGKHLLDFWCNLWAKHVGVEVTYEQIPRKYLEDSMGPMGREIADMFEAFGTIGYDGGDPNMLYPWDLGNGLENKVTKMEDYVKKTDWSPLLKA
jgi:hypothetical protein